MKPDIKSECLKKTERVQYSTEHIGFLKHIEIEACTDGVHRIFSVPKPDPLLKKEPTEGSSLYLPYLWIQQYFSTDKDNAQKKMDEIAGNNIPPICWKSVGKTEFETSVLKACFENVKFGQKVSYGDLAKILQKTKASRAVGNALGRNPVMFLIPCHRVVYANGKIGNYSGGGNSVKQFLINFEKLM